MDFVTSLPILINCKGDSYDLIFVIIDWLMKMVHYKPVKITFNTLRLTEILIDVVIYFNGLLDLIFTNRNLLFILNFWSLLCYSFVIKKNLSTTFHP